MISRPDYPTHFLEGLDRFNARRFWDAHESWETLWLQSTSEVKQFLQGLIQVAAAYHHIQRGTLRGVPRLVDAGLRRLAMFPPGFNGVDRAAAEAAARRDRDITGPLADADFPSLTLLVARQDFLPPRQDW